MKASVRRGTICCGTTRHDTIRYGRRHDIALVTLCNTNDDTTPFYTMRYDTIRHDTVLYDIVLFDSTRYDTI